CPAKYSPARISSTPASYADSNFSVFHLDVVRAELDREVELVLARAHVVLPPVPGAREHAALQLALAERPLEVEAVPLHGVEAAIAVGQGDLLLAGLDAVDGSGGNIVDSSDGDEAVFHAGDPTKGLSGHARARYPLVVATILLCGFDVFFRFKLERLRSGHHFVTTYSA